MNVVLNATYRELGSKSLLKSIRNLGEIPCIMYGMSTTSVPIQVNSLDVNSLIDSLGKNNVSNTVITLNLPDVSKLVLIYGMEYCKISTKILHIDFFTIEMDSIVSLRVPLKVLNAVPDMCQGIKEGGIVRYNFSGLICKCMVDHIPPVLCIDVAGMHLKQSAYLDRLIIPKNIEVKKVVADTAIVSIVKQGV